MNPTTSFRRLSFAFVAATVVFVACGSPHASAPLVPFGVAPAEIGAAKGSYKLLHLFRGGPDGAEPFAGLTPLGGKLYGVTYGNNVGGFGTFFSITSSGKVTTLYRFKGMPDGVGPAGNLAVVNGKLYGTTVNGGKHDLGCIFTITPSGREHVIYSFKGGTDGANPEVGLIEYHGKLYGTTQLTGSGSGNGVVFEITAGKERVLHTFAGSPGDGSYPFAPLVALNGKLYGTTESGGENSNGTVFAMR
ncbi:MAG: hypothetical protein JO092_07575, partial [Candidatus Eremiobacteraeota bacterium]|nr:hypothetical protein [Candidatus Eremiobacteraeota bacterium]